MVLSEKNWLANALREAGLLPTDADQAAAERLLAYARLLAEANRNFNLIGPGAFDDLLKRHILDCALGFAFLQRRGLALGAVADIGSGAGLPGVVWAILGGFDRVVCCESNAKKARFIQEAARELGLDHLGIEIRRAEILGHDPQWRESFSVVTARALAPLNVLMELTAPLARIGGVCLYFKGRGVDAETAGAGEAMAQMRLIPAARERYGTPEGTPGGEWLLYEKVGPIPDRYPRRPGIPAKRPLKNI